MKLLMFTAFCLLTAATCKNTGEKVAKTSQPNQSKHIEYIDVKGNQYKSFGDIPDSLRTPDQKIYAKSLNDVLLNGVKVENNHMVLKLSKEECLAKGMTEQTYNDLQKNLRDNNHYFDSLGVKNVAAMIDNMHKDLIKAKSEH